MTVSNSKKRYLNYLYEKTYFALENKRTTDFETDAITLSVDLDIHRANVSRMLNELWRENLLIKIEGRPTYYLHRECIKTLYSQIFIPSVISKEDTIWNYLKTDKATKLINVPQIIGGMPNETLHKMTSEMAIQFNYAFRSKRILLYGAPCTGKYFLINQFRELDRQATKIFELNWQLIACDDQLWQDFFAQVERDTADFENLVLVIHGIDLLNIPRKRWLQAWLECFEREYFASTGKLIVFFHYQAAELEENHTELFLNHTYAIPTFDERTLKEKTQFILQFLQNESDTIQLSIECPVAVLNCLIASKYQQNFFELENELERTVAKTKHKAEQEGSKLLRISYDELSDEVLNHISKVSEILSEIRQVNSIWKSDRLYFIPQVKNEAYTLIENLPVDEEGRISILSLDKISLTKYIHHFFHTMDEQSAEVLELKIDPTLHKEVVRLMPTEFSLVEIKAVTNELQQLFLGKHKKLDNLPFYIEEDKKPSEIAKKLQLFLLFFEKRYKTIPNEMIHFLQQLLIYKTDESFAAARVSILVICHGKDIAEKYISSIKTRGYDCRYDYLNYKSDYQGMKFTAFLTEVSQKINEVDAGKGVVLLTDVEPLSSIAQILSENLPNALINISPISLPLLNQVCQICSDTETTIEDVQNLVSTDNRTFRIKTISKADSTYKILSESLTFLDPEKVVTVCETVFANILEEEKITYKENLKLRFVFHCSFMIERAIRREPLKMRNISAVIERNLSLYQSIEKNVQILNEVFGTQVVIDEIVRLSEIFSTNPEVFS
ncbi:PRD domain-containing protein [Candidatus Enterococcus ferrettii]|uniref:Transcriptional antiterminator n=1 Tax=Candidatus Enterococcus ferrettii TaxID=2815324 RepID=A0ABV0EJ28_9ENTE|nr:PRD domain-containing protein [Enterococcus sp. 665A]MBO1339192.1 PRD domain-containing protein [Enterococcus sp. 665A]